MRAKSKEQRESRSLEAKAKEGDKGVVGEKWFGFFTVFDIF